MARQRIIKPEFFTDEDLAGCSPHARLLFAGLWTLADKRGRAKDQPPVIHGAIFPYEPALKVDELLGELAAHGFIERYEVDGRRYIAMPNFEKHQHPHPKEVESLNPPPPKSNGRAVDFHGSTARFLPVPSVPSVPSKPSDNDPPYPPRADARRGDSPNAQQLRDRDDAVKYWIQLGGRPGRRQRREVLEVLRSGTALSQVKGSISELVREAKITAGELRDEDPWPPQGLAPYDQQQQHEVAS